MAETVEGPSYFKLQKEIWDAANDLPKAQARKLLYAIEALYFTGEEPEEGELPREARRMFDMHRYAIESYRRNSIKGAKNRAGSAQ